jgi:hypothetical protein
MHCVLLVHEYSLPYPPHMPPLAVVGALKIVVMGAAVNPVPPERQTAPAPLGNMQAGSLDAPEQYPTIALQQIALTLFIVASKHDRLRHGEDAPPPNVQMPLLFKSHPK